MFTHVYMNLCVCMRVCVWGGDVCVGVCVYECLCVCMCECVCMCVWVYANLCFMCEYLNMIFISNVSLCIHERLIIRNIVICLSVIYSEYIRKL